MGPQSRDPDQEERLIILTFIVVTIIALAIYTAGHSRGRQAGAAESVGRAVAALLLSKRR